MNLKHNIKSNTPSTLTIFGGLLILLLIVNEEIVFRQYIYNNLLYYFSNDMSIIISSLLFACVHMFNIDLFDFNITVLFSVVNQIFRTFILGIYICLITDKLYYQIMIHFIFNIVSLAFIFISITYFCNEKNDEIDDGVDDSIDRLVDLFKTNKINIRRNSFPIQHKSLLENKSIYLKVPNNIKVNARKLDIFKMNKDLSLGVFSMPF
jgi:hypothetical protein